MTVLVNAHVNKVIPASDSGSEFVAESVEFKQDGQVYVAKAKKEVILSTG